MPALPIIETAEPRSTAEAIRLVIWDLDETFWKGTLTEGGIQYDEISHDIVIELSHRGIINSICSRNDFDSVAKILQERGIWDYFVFPSVDWTPKGQRIRRIVEAVQLRPETVLFIDDNPMNRAEALQAVPGLQVACENRVQELLSDPLLAGKDDFSVSRLKQYKVLEERQRIQSTTEDPVEFLGASQICVQIVYDVEEHLDRAIELINRTNQLNFTKLRLPEDIGGARHQLCELLSGHNIQAGLAHVWDRFGDYGFVGLYILRREVGQPPQLIHYCFSCRTLGMHVETWLYRRLGRPNLTINGCVLTDVIGDDREIDWVHLDRSLISDERKGEVKGIPRIVLRGGCEMLALAHYLQLLTDKVIGEYVFVRDGISIKIDHSIFLRYSLDRLSESSMTALHSLGYKDEDFLTAVAELGSDDDVFLFAFWGMRIRGCIGTKLSDTPSHSTPFRRSAAAT